MEENRKTHRVQGDKRSGNGEETQDEWENMVRVRDSGIWVPGTWGVIPSHDKVNNVA